VIEVLGYCDKHKEIVMECGWHGSFDKLFLATPPPPVGIVLRILLHAARGMLFFHHLREQYRLDLKEQNVVLGCECHFTLKRCTRDPLDEGHKLVGKLADFGTLTSNPLDSRAGTSTHQDAVAQQGIAGAPLSYDDRHNFGVMMRNALERVTGEVPPKAGELASRCTDLSLGLRPSVELICEELRALVDAIGGVKTLTTAVDPVTERLRDNARYLKLARFGTDKRLSPATMEWPEAWRLEREAHDTKRVQRLYPADLKRLLQRSDLPTTERRVFIWARAPAGYGKSTLCKYLAHGWATGEGLLKDEACVIYIPLGEAMKDVRGQGAVELNTVLFFHWRKLLSALTMEQVQAFTDGNSKALFIFDGVDDGMRAGDAQGQAWLKSLVTGHVKCLARVLLCGRADDTLQFAGTQIELAGLVDPNAFVRAYFAGRTDSDARMADIEGILQRQDVAGMLRSPFALQLVCTLLDGKETEAVPRTLTALYKQVIEKLLRRGLEELKDEVARDIAAAVVDRSVPVVLSVDVVRSWSVDRVCEWFEKEFEADEVEVSSVRKARLNGKAASEVLLGRIPDLSLGSIIQAVAWVDNIKKVVAPSPPSKSAAQQAREVLDVLEKCNLVAEGLYSGLRSLNAEQRGVLLSCGILKVVGDTTHNIKDSVEGWELREWDWYHSSFEDFFVARHLMRCGRECGAQNTETVYLTLKPLACSSRLGWQFAFGLLVESDAPTLRAALWRLLFVGMRDDPGVLVEKELLDWRLFVEECGSIADPNDKAAGLLCVADATCSLDSPLAAASRYESALAAAKDSAVSIDVSERVFNMSGICFVSIGRLTEAIDLFTWALRSMEQRDAGGSRVYGDVFSNLATVSKFQGDLKKALELYQQSLAIMERNVGKDNQSYAMTLHNIALVHRDQGDLKQALELYQQSLAITERTVGKDNVSYATTLHSIAQVHQEQGDLKKALELYQQSLTITERTVGKDNKSYALTLHSIAQVHRDQGDLNQALELYQQSLAITERIVGKDKESYATTLHDIAHVHREQAELKKALELYQQSLAIKERTVGKDNESYATTLASIASVKSVQGELQKALELYQESLRLLQFNTSNRYNILDDFLRLLRNTPASQIVSGRLVGFVQARVQFHVDVSDPELCLGFSDGTAPLVQQLLECNSLRDGKSILLLGPDVVQQCLNSVARNKDSAARASTLSWLRSNNSTPPCTEGLLLALSCGVEDVAREWMDGGAVVTKECAAVAQSLSVSAELVSALTEHLEVATKGKGNSFLQGTVAAAPQSGKKSGAAKKKGQKKGQKKK
jgi:tetratricopeptide (TPR) repeat protein